MKDSLARLWARKGAAIGGDLSSKVPGKGRDLVGEPTVAQLVASTAAARGTGAVWHADGYRYAEAPAVATDHDEITANGVKLYAQPVNGYLETNQFSGGIGARFNKAVAAAKRMRVQNPSLVWFPDTLSIRINPGSYTFDEQLRIENMPNLQVLAWGVSINSFTSATTPFWAVNCPFLIIDGLFFNLRNNNNVSECAMLAGMCSWVTFRNVRVQVNTTNVDYASWRLKQGNSAGFDDADRNKGNFWVTLENCWVRKLSGADPGDCRTLVDLQGCQNAFKAINCKFTAFHDGVTIGNQNGNAASGITNAPEFISCDFEGWTGVSIYFKAATGASMAGGCAMGCRFEAGLTAFRSDLTAAPAVPFQIWGTTSISSVTNYIVDARTLQDSFASLDASVTPSSVTARHISSKGVFFGSGNTTNGSVRALAKQAANGGTVVLERADGTIDGKLSQRSGGGLDIDGGATARVRIVGVSGLSGHASQHAANFRGNVTLSSGASQIAVTLANAEADTSYAIALDIPYNTSAWVSDKTVNGFNINVGTPPGASQVFRWMLWR